MRRTIGLGGAAFVAVGAALVLTLPASAHATVATPGCATDGTATIEIHTTIDYDAPKDHPKDNTVKVLEGTKTVFSDTFGKNFSHTVSLDGTVAHSIVVQVRGFNGKGNIDIPLDTAVCPGNKPSETSTTQPPTTTAVPSQTSKPAATTTAALAGASSSGQLPNTGVSTAVPLLVAGVLVVAGGGILLWLRLGAKRRRTDS
jgi:LPXTG-motif cell wall-anchored protein